MTPPTGVSDSILIARRNEALLEPYYRALVPHVQKYPMESDPNKTRKPGRDKRSLSKPGNFSINRHMIESSNFMVHPDYLQKYGTLSNGVITKSIKYAEHWLYGTVGVRGVPAHRPSLFIYPGVLPSSSRIGNDCNHQSSSGVFFSDPPSINPSDYKGRVMPPLRNDGEHPFMQQKNDLRIYPFNGNSTLSGKKSKGGNGTLSKSGSSLKDSISIRDKEAVLKVSDPYNLMRKSRLGTVETVEPSILNYKLSQNKKANAYSSPPNQKFLEQNFDVFKPKAVGKEIKRWPNKKEDNIKPEEETGRRKSILECDVNAYELNKSESKDFSDFSEELDIDISKVETTKLKILRPKLNKTENRNSTIKKSVGDKGKITSKSNTEKETECSTQNYVFDHSNSAATASSVTDKGNEGEVCKNALNEFSSPKRPPRRHKENKPSKEITQLKHSKSRSKSSPNLSIKSILKKPTSGDDLITFEWSPQEQECTSDNFDLENAQSTASTLQVDQKSKISNQSTLKKKKQVQFKVSNNISEISSEKDCSVDVLEVSRSDAENNDERRDLQKMKVASISQNELVHRSKSCENLTVTEKIEKDLVDPVETTTDTIMKSDDQNVPKNPKNSLSNEDVGSRNSGVGLRRSYSDRRSTPSGLHQKNGSTPVNSSSSNYSQFSDTMALRTRTTRLDTREIFSKKPKTHQKDQKSEESLKNISPSTSKISSSEVCEPAENEFSGKLITYVEFSKLVDDVKTEQPNTLNKPLNKKCKTVIKSNTPVKTKAPAPSPPLRKATNKKIEKKPGTISVKVSMNECDKSVQSNLNSDTTACHEIPVVTGLHEVQQLNSSSETVQHEQKINDKKTVVTLSENLNKENDFESVSSDHKKASITIHPKNIMQEWNKEPQRRTSMIISNFDPQDSNKVTINVTNENCDGELSSSTCTIIETGSNSTVIPVLSKDNKTTLIVGNNSSSPLTTVNKPNLNSLSFNSESEKKIESSILSEEEKRLQMLDPVEAVKRNLVPHICGKNNENMDSWRETEQINETNDQKNLKQILQLFVDCGAPAVPDQAAEKLNSSNKDKNSNWSNVINVSKSRDSSTTTSRSNSFCSTLNSSGKNSSTNTSRSNSFRSNCKKLNGDNSGEQAVSGLITKSKVYILSDAEDGIDQEKNKLECEYEIRNEFKENKKDDVENVYEVIKEEPVYDVIKTNLENNTSLSSNSDNVETQQSVSKSMFEGATKYDILSYLVDAKERVGEDLYFNGTSGGENTEYKRLSYNNNEKALLDTENNSNYEKTSRNNKFISKPNSEIESNNILSTTTTATTTTATTRSTEKKPVKLTKKSSVEIERNDSGIGSEASHSSRSKWQASSGFKEDPRNSCEDCGQVVEAKITESGVMYIPLVCRKCSKKRSERKDIIQEIVETEEKYGRDLKIIIEEFYNPMLVAGLLTPEQLSAIFLNTEELLENSVTLTERLRDTLEIAMEQGDEDFLTVNVGKLFLEAEPMLHAFESYCTRQGAAALLLTNLEKEKELLRIFLRVSQMENTVLRRMNLNSFLMVPVQRVTKYPLLLARLYKVTPAQQVGRELLKEAQHNIELHLEHMNSEAKDISGTKVWRRFSTSTISGRKAITEIEMNNIKLRKMAVDVLEWNHEDVRFVLEGKLLYTQPTDNNWKRGKTIKLTPIFVLLVTLGKPNAKYKIDPAENDLIFPAKTGIKEATLLLVKEKCGRYTLVREPLYLDKIIVCCETDVDESFEVQELVTKDSFIFKAEDCERTKEWYKQLQYHAQIVGAWRKRRNALANIMINGMMARAQTS